MGSNIEFVAYIADQLQEAGYITYRKMFGEYGMYCDGKIFGLVCDDQLFIKITEGGKKTAPGLKTAPPYEGAKDYLLVDDVEEKEMLLRLVTVTCEELPEPKPKKRKEKKNGL